MPELDKWTRRIFRLTYKSGLALSLVLAALAVTILFKNHFEGAPAALFLCAVAISSWLGGTEPGLLATLASAAAIYSPLLHLHESASQGIPRLLVFLFCGALISFMGGAQKRAKDSLRQARDDLELKVRERTIELRQVNEELHAEIVERKEATGALLSREAQLNQAQRLAHLGSYEIDVLEGTSRWSDELFRILGRDPANGALSRQEFVDQIVHPEDRPFAIQSFHEAIHQGKPYAILYRVRRPDGSVRFVQSMGAPVKDSEGIVVRVAGALLGSDRRHLNPIKFSWRCKTPASGSSPAVWITFSRPSLRQNRKGWAWDWRSAARS